jgi:putative transcriptional regulator
MTLASSLATLLLATVLASAQSKSAQSLAAGNLLVATRDLDDPNFAKTVILLVHYDEEGVVGLIVNRRTEVSLARAFERMKGAKGRDDCVYQGGPVEPTGVFALRQSTDKVQGAANIFGGVYLISNHISLEKAFSLRPDPDSFRVYLGYTGWTNQQLKNELELGAWFVFRGDAGAVFDSEPDTLWSRLIRKTEQRLALLN